MAELSQHSTGIANLNIRATDPEVGLEHMTLRLSISDWTSLKH